MRKFIIFIFILQVFNITAENGEFVWEIALPGKVLSTPIERGNGEIILICDDRRLYSLNSKTGSINWRIKPGGRLNFLDISPDGSIIIRDEKNIYSIYGNGSNRWSRSYEKGFNSDMTINDRGDLLFNSDNKLYILDRFGEQRVILDTFSSKSISALSNSLLIYAEEQKIISITYSGQNAWKIDISRDPILIKSFNNGFFLIYKDGLIEQYSLIGELLNSLNTGNTNIHTASLNAHNNIIVMGDSGTTLIDGDFINFDGVGEDSGLYYSDGLLIKSQSDWSIHGLYIDSGFEYYPSGKIQLFKRDVSLAHKKVWGDEFYSEFYRNTILDGNRASQKKILKYLEDNINKPDLLDAYPNFYEILLLASSKQNKNQDTRQEAYRIIGLSRNLSFLPYLQSDLEEETSYLMIPYIYFALGQIGIDRTGGIISTINSRIDDYYDEKLVINALYALYNINQYTNGEFTYLVFSGIERILDGGYSRKIENQCYDIIKKIK